MILQTGSVSIFRQQLVVREWGDGAGGKMRAAQALKALFDPQYPNKSRV